MRLRYTLKLWGTLNVTLRLRVSPIFDIKKYRKDASLVLRLALPVVLTNLLQTSVNVLDVFMIGRLGSMELAAVGMGLMARMLIMVGMIAVGSGAMVLIAQAKGARNHQRMKEVARQGVVMAVLLGAILGAVGFVIADPLLYFIDGAAPDEIRSLGVEYLKIFFYSTIFMSLTFTTTQMMQGAGDTITPLWLMAGMNVLNITLSALMIFGLGPIPALGVKGAAYGLLYSRVVFAGLGVWILASGRNIVSFGNGNFLPNWRMIHNMISIGVPSALQGILNNATTIFIARIVTSTPTGTFGIAAMAIGNQIVALSFMPALAVSVAATSLVGQSMGAWRPEEGRLRGNLSLILGSMIMVAAGIPMMVFPEALVRFFDAAAHPLVVEAGTSFVRIHGAGQIFIALGIVGSGALRGAGDTITALIAAVVGRALIVLPFAYLLGITLGFGLPGIWWAIIIGSVIQAAIVIIRWRGSRWIDIALQRSVIYQTHLKHLPLSKQLKFVKDVRTPLMANTNMREFVREDGAIYDDGATKYYVTFANNAFEITSQSLVDRPAARLVGATGMSGR